MKKVMFIGTTGSGKTTLTQALSNEKIEYKKTQAVDFRDYIIDTPGEYIDNKMYYNALIVTSSEADVIVLIQDCSRELSVFPPAFGSIFDKPIIGVCTKIDLCKNEDDLKRSEEFLKQAGAEKIFPVSSINNDGLEDLKKYLECK
ncbi:MAG: EutP/PduV family microcompartment system protein [Clostridium argentinense]|uniref:EutP/PduV family microcompartment system protein n=1 Tax=Clostridium faecium TaxID=2762223 RepID=A0ABR8YNP1_9CLOT|nr:MULTISPECIES: EutP/PduV family microcompartment system protein [Clostridium]MBD8045549.1 EutP/PduV family microcompartment system protein [Clostridium faecium]MBS5825210.1 EutP/PduV family microcompartment system protein [Clostridium argentinense]MDU1350340.1 EutP/PduV family microcompartment system protein [Clostridium argentinense]